MSAMEQPPTVLFIHGAWHTSECFSTVQKDLASHGYGIKDVQLPSSTTGSRYVQGIDEDVEVIQNALNDIVLTDSDIIVVMHSYGGIPGSSAVKGFTKAERRKQGKDGGIIHLLYIAAFIVDEGKCLKDGSGGQLAPWITIEGENTYMTASAQARDVFYNDLSESDAALWTSKLTKQATKAFYSPATYAGWKHIPSTYILCAKDNAIPGFAQEMFVSQEGANFNVVRFEDAGHSPFLSKPKETVEVIRKAAGEKI